MSCATRILSKSSRFHQPYPKIAQHFKETANYSDTLHKNINPIFSAESACLIAAAVSQIFCVFHDAVSVFPGSQPMIIPLYCIVLWLLFCNTSKTSLNTYTIENYVSLLSIRGWRPWSK